MTVETETVYSSDMQNAEDVPEETLVMDWTLTASDVECVFTHCYRSPENLLRFAIQLCVLRKTGRFIQNYHETPIKAVQYLARQLELEPVLFIAPSERSATEYNYRKIICEYLRFRNFDEATETQSLLRWMENKFHHDAPSQVALLDKAENLLFSQRIILPTRMQLGRLVASLKNQVQQKIYEQINQKITPQTRQQLDMLLEPALISLQDFKRSPPEPSVRVIHEYMDRLNALEKIDIPALDLSDIHPNLIEAFYHLANTYSAWDLRRIMPEPKRYALMVCFLSEAYKMLLDHLIELNDKMLSNKERESRNQFNKKAKTARKWARNAEKIMSATLKTMYKQVQTLDMSLSVFIASLDNDKVNKAITDSDAYHQYEEEGVLQELHRRYGYLRKYTTRFFDLDFKAACGSENLLQAIKILQQLNNGSLKNIPKNAPCHFVPAAWCNALHNPDGSICQRPWELALYDATKKALGSGDLYFPNSNNHRNFWQTVYDEKSWQEDKSRAYSKLKLPTQFDEVLRKLKIELEKNVEIARKNIHEDSFAYIGKDGELKLHHDDALPIHESTKKLRQQIEARLPIIRIENLLAEVDETIHFSQCFMPPKDFTLKTEIPNQHLHAAILAHATNMGLYGMAHSVEDMILEELRHASRWLIYADTLKAGNAHLVNEHSKLPLSKIYGSGHRSGSDAQRYGIRASSLLASFYPRYYGYYDKAISIYTHLSDLFSVFSTLVVSCGVREATYVITGLLEHDSLLSPKCHCTDTHGFTHHIFALCYLLGFSFQPRLKDLVSQRLFKLDNTNYGEIDALFSEIIDIELVREQWDNLVRITASLIKREYPAHLIIDKLAHRIDTDRTAKALVELGKIVKTIFILRYISSSEFRHTIQLQLNRGEHRHYLAQHVFFADQGIFKTNDYEEIMNKASCLSFVSNAILYWNTVQITKIVEQLKAEGYPVNEEDLARISPLMFKHIVVTGTYHFLKVV